MMNNYLNLMDKYMYPSLGGHAASFRSNMGYKEIGNASDTSSLSSFKSKGGPGIIHIASDSSSSDLSDITSPSASGLVGEGGRTPRLIPEIQITDEQLITIKTKQLNRLLKGVSKERQREIKYERRTLKNRGYADSSRKKRLLEKEYLEKELQDIDAELEERKSQINHFKMDISGYKSKCDALLRTLDPLPGGSEFKENIRKLALENIPKCNSKMREVVAHLGDSAKFSRPG